MYFSINPLVAVCILVTCGSSVSFNINDKLITKHKYNVSGLPHYFLPKSDKVNYFSCFNGPDMGLKYGAKPSRILIDDRYALRTNL